MRLKLGIFIGLSVLSLASGAQSSEEEPGSKPLLAPRSATALLEHYECTRCHESPELVAAPPEKQCVGCHSGIQEGTIDAPADILAEWRPRIIDLNVAPRLESIGSRFKQEWLYQFLLSPTDLRSHMRATMPRFSMSEADALTIARHLSPNEASPPPDALWFAQPSRGKRLIEQHGCVTCHDTSGFEEQPQLRSPSVVLSEKALRQGIELAPDLRHTRARYRPEALIQWLQAPHEVLPQSAMPDFKFTRQEALDVAAWLLETPLVVVEPKPIPTRLPLLQREVRYPEVEARIFHKVCWHCHAEADLALGDGGPGNTGGFGFPPRGLSLRDYAAVNSGYLDDEGKRRSVFRPLKDGPLAGTPKLVAHMLARQIEEAGGDVPGIRGMPLGLPAFSAEEIQLLESWIEQGRPE